MNFLCHRIFSVQFSNHFKMQKAQQQNPVDFCPQGQYLHQGAPEAAWGTDLIWETSRECWGVGGVVREGGWGRFLGEIDHLNSSSFPRSLTSLLVANLKIPDSTLAAFPPPLFLLFIHLPPKSPNENGASKAKEKLFTPKWFPSRQSQTKETQNTCLKVTSSGASVPWDL